MLYLVNWKEIFLISLNTSSFNKIQKLISFKFIEGKW